MVQQAFEDAWVDSLVNDPQRRHEEGGWIYCDAASGEIVTRRDARVLHRQFAEDHGHLALDRGNGKKVIWKDWMAMSVVPIARAVYLCDFHVGYSDGKVDLYGLFNGIRSSKGFPHTKDRFCVFAQLTNGLGKVSCHVDIRSARNDELIWATGARELTFRTRQSLVQLALYVEGCRFEQPGLYVIELFCDNSWVCDSQVVLR